MSTSSSRTDRMASTADSGRKMSTLTMMTRKTSNTTTDPRRDSCLHFTSMVRHLPRAAFEIAKPWDFYEPEPRRDSLITLNHNTQASSSSDLMQEFLAHSIELQVHKMIAAVMFGIVEERLIEALEYMEEVRDELEGVQWDLLRVRERKEGRRRTEPVIFAAERERRGLERRWTTDAVVEGKRPGLGRSVTWAADVDDRRPAGNESPDDVIVGEEELKDLRRSLIAECQSLDLQITRLQQEWRGTGMMNRSFQKVRAKVEGSKRRALGEMLVAERGEGPHLPERRASEGRQVEQGRWKWGSVFWR